MTNLRVVPDEIPELKLNMVVEVVHDFDVGVIEPGDRGRIIADGAKAKMMMFSRWPMANNGTIYDAPLHFKTGVVKLVDVDVPTSVEHEGQRSDAITKALKQHSFDASGWNLREKISRDRLDAAIFRVVRAVPGILPFQVVLCFIRDEKRKESARYSYAHTSLRRLISANRVRVTTTGSDDDADGTRYYPV